MNEIFICVLSMTQDTTNTGRNLADKLMQIFLDSTTKEFNILFFPFSAKNKSQYWYGNEQKLQSILSKKFVLSDPNLSIANHCPLFWQFTKLFFKN